jgi:hypothetical protein
VTAGDAARTKVLLTKREVDRTARRVAAASVRREGLMREDFLSISMVKTRAVRM